MKVIYLTVRVELEDTVDVDDFVSEVNYVFTGDGIMSTEIVDVETSHK